MIQLTFRMKNPLISVLIPVYGVEQYIERCATSIYLQTYKNLEIIFVDDCSPDNSVDIILKTLEKFPERKNQSKIIKHSINKGLASARLTGLLNAKGKYILNCDSDDYIMPRMIEEMVSVAEQANSDMVICDMMMVHRNSSQCIHVNPSLNPNELLVQLFNGKVHASVCNKLIKRDLYVLNNIFPLEGLNMREDLYVMYKLVYFSHNIAYLPKPFYFYDLSNDKSYTSSIMNLRAQEDSYKIIKDITSFFELNCADNLIHQAIVSFETGIFSLIAMYGDLCFYKQEKELFMNITIRSIIKHPCMNFHSKFFGCLLFFNAIHLIKLVRLIKNTCKKYII